MKTVKSITHVFYQDNIERQRVVGIFAPDKIVDGLDEIRKTMTKLGKTIKADTKDCCNYFIEFTDDKKNVDRFYTGDFILNEIDL